MNNPGHKIIFEGAELSGKSYLMSQVFNWLEPKYNTAGRILNGCHWFNCDVGLYGTPYGQDALSEYTDLLEKLQKANVMIEKFHITEYVYQRLYNNQEFDYTDIENRLLKLNAKIILTTFREDEELLEKRLQDRLNLYPHYEKIAQKPQDYINQQQLYKQILAKSRLEYLIVDSSVLPNLGLVEQILKFLKEK